ncbi:cytochrome b5 domain-containing protein [Candidatus Woesearchaeota archaeon]|nr:cytochrome b5 domain-containing protein [Candidatus Woesearchaeota archaeon]
MDIRPFIAIAALLIVLLFVIVAPAEAPASSLPTANSNLLTGNVVSDDKAINEPQLTMVVVEEHATAEDCWTIIEDKVYDITSYVPFHPGGKAEITRICGGDGTALFTTSAGRKHSDNAHDILTGYYVGDLGSAISPSNEQETLDEEQRAPSEKTFAPPAEVLTEVVTEPEVIIETPVETIENTNTILTLALVQAHTSTNDCWTIINDKVYDITSYVPFHPGGLAEIARVCGVDGTALFTTSAGRTHSQNAHNLLINYYVGDLGAVTSTTTPATTTTTTTTTTDDTTDDTTSTTGGSTSTSSVQEAIESSYPGAIILKQEYEDDGEIEGTFSWNGQKYEFKADAAGNMLEVKPT